MHYKTGFCFTPKDFYDTMNLKTVKMPKTLFKEKFGKGRKKDLCCSMLIYCFYLILVDIIENNVTFVFPVKGGDAMLHLEAVKGEEFKTGYQIGKYKDIDFFESDFTGYRLMFTYRTFTRTLRKKEVYFNDKFKQRLYKLVNSGKKYY